MRGPCDVSQCVFEALGSVEMWLNQHSITGISLDAAGLIALADLTTIAERTALTGRASFLDILLLAPGIHRQQKVSEVNGGELPSTGAMHSGFVFRVENVATVAYLQKVGRTGSLVTVQVQQLPSQPPGIRNLRQLFSQGNTFPSFLYCTAIIFTILVFAILGSIRDFWAVGVLLTLILARFLNTLVIKRRSQLGWKGVLEPGVQGDLLVLLSQDRWVRIQGTVDDLKKVTSGQWLRDPTMIEGFATAFATLLVYGSAAVASNASRIGQVFVAGLLLISVALLGLCNSFTKDLQMFGCSMRVVGEAKFYRRRLDMANELIAESGRNDWAISMGLITPPTNFQAVKVNC